MATCELTIEELGLQGDGIHLGARGKVYVDRALPGDIVRVEVERDDQGVLRGDLLEIIEPSSYRQKAPCVHYDRCGNCSLQHLKSDTYRIWKTEKVKEVFHAQRLQPLKWLPTVFLGGQNRRRATFTAEKDLGHTVMGYHRRRSQDIFDTDVCMVADPVLMELREKAKVALNRFMREEESLDVFFQLVGGAAEMVLTGEMGASNEKILAALEPLLETTPIVRIGWRPDEQENVQSVLYRKPLTAVFGKLPVELPPAAFLQPTAEGEAALVKAVMDALPMKGKFADLFSGCGTFSGPMLDRGPVEAYESSPSSVQALSRAGRNVSLKAFRRDLFHNPLRRDELNRFDAVVFDPPRAGCVEQAAHLADAKTRTLVAVSCNPMTLARDARVLCDGGYWLQTVQVIDQFVWSHHVEVVAVFSKQKRRK